MTMSADTTRLRDLYLDLTDEATLTERQREEPARDPVAEADAAIEEEVSRYARSHGLEDALDGFDDVAASSD